MSERLLARALHWYQRRPVWLRWLLVLVWVGVIWHQSSLSPAPGPSPWWNPYLHNALHIPAFGLLAVLVLLATRGALLAVGCTLLYGVVDEWHQSFTPGRVSSAQDVLTDVLGACCAVACVRWAMVGGGKRSAIVFGVAALASAWL